MSSIRRAGAAPRPAQARSVSKPARPPAPARVEGRSSFEPLKLVKRLVERFERMRDPVKSIDNASQKTEWFDAPLVVKGIDGRNDVQQGGLGDCYMVATVASIAHQHPDLIKKMMTENADGTVSFRFFKKVDDAWGRPQFQPVVVTVDRTLPMRSDGSLPFGKSGQHEAWFPLLEKAYAQLHGGVQAIGNGGYISDAQEAILGTPARWLKTSASTPPQIFEQLQRELAAGNVIGVSTPHFAENRPPLRQLLDVFKATVEGIVPGHVYSVWGTQEVDGKQYVLLRNPWADTEPGSFGPFGSWAVDGANDGVFAMPLEDFAKRFASLSSAPAPAAR